MIENRTIHLVDIPIGGKGGFMWNRLHEERENICEALLKDGTAESKAALQSRLRKVDDALDRLMSGTGNSFKSRSLSLPQEGLTWVGDKKQKSADQ